MLTVQERISDAFNAGLHQGAHLVDNADLAAALQSHPHLTAEQQHLVRTWCQRGHRIHTAIGRAGAGKTTTVAACADAWTTDGYRVLGAAVKGEATRTLAAATGIECETVAWYLAHTDPHDLPIDGRTILVVDEASTLSDRDLDTLITMAATTGASLRLIGDPAQHSSIAAGGMFRVICEHHRSHTPELITTHRLQNRHDRAAAEALRDGRIDEAFDELAQAGHLHVVNSTDSPTFSDTPTENSPANRSQQAETGRSRSVTESRPGHPTGSFTSSATATPTSAMAPWEPLLPFTTMATQAMTRSRSTSTASAPSTFHATSSTNTGLLEGVLKSASITPTRSPAMPFKAPRSTSQRAASTRRPAERKPTSTSREADRPTTSTSPSPQTSSMAKPSRASRQTRPTSPSQNVSDGPQANSPRGKSPTSGRTSRSRARASDSEQPRREVGLASAAYTHTSPPRQGATMTTTNETAKSDVLTIDEAAAILRISRNAAYAAAREWRATGGKTGIPCIEIGRTLRVPRTELDRLLGRIAS